MGYGKTRSRSHIPLPRPVPQLGNYIIAAQQCRAAPVKLIDAMLRLIGPSRVNRRLFRIAKAIEQLLGELRSDLRRQSQSSRDDFCVCFGHN